MLWFYALEGRRIGPVEEAELRALHRSGVLQSGTLVWSPALADWQPFETVVARIDPSAPPAAAREVRLCLECGQPFPPEALLIFGRSAVCGQCKPVFQRRLKQGTLPAADPYAGFGARFLAKMIDWIILGIFQNTFYFAFSGGMTLPNATVLTSILLSFSGMGFMLGYNAWFLGRFRATPGKMALGLEVVRYDGRPLSYARALGRSAAEIVSMLLMYLGYIMVALDPEKRGLHDFVADTRVLRKDNAGISA